MLVMYDLLPQMGNTWFRALGWSVEASNYLSCIVAYVLS